METTLEKCENCGRAIGKLETPLLFDGHVVCAKCERDLKSAQPAMPVEDMAAEVRREVSSRVDDSEQQKIEYQRRVAKFGPAGDWLICANPNCKYKGKGATRRKAKLGISLSLLAIWIIAGALAGFTGAADLWIVSLCAFIAWLGYTIFMHGTITYCPRCKLKV